MDSGVAPHLRGAGPIFLRPVLLRGPPCVVRWSAWRATEAAVPRSVLPSKPRRELLLACVYLVKGMVGKDVVGEDEARADMARAPVASA
jgi:hypothetical protein